MDNHTLREAAVNKAHLTLEGKHKLLHLLNSNPQVCTLRLGTKTVLQHCLYTTHPVPIKQCPYWLTPEKYDVVKDQFKEVLQNGTVEPSHSAWACIGSSPKE